MQLHIKHAIIRRLPASLSFLLVLFFIPAKPFAQKIKECGTKTPATPLKYTKERMALAAPTASLPYLLKVAVHVIANNDGSNRACDDTDVINKMNLMRDFYAPHNICFVLVGIDQINNTDLNSHNASTEEAELTPYVAPNVMNVFVHSFLTSSDGDLNGVAYHLPGNTLSIVSDAIKSSTNLSTLAHEMGHNLGLYHTFETDFGAESVPRSGSCANCDTNGDLICDTPADPESSTYSTIDHIFSCVFFDPDYKEPCSNVPYSMDPKNIMAYGDRPCRSYFTNGQGARARVTIEDNSILTNAIAPDILNITGTLTLFSSIYYLASRNSLTINSPGFSILGSTEGNLVSTSVTLQPGVLLSPTGNGFTSVRVNTFCR